MLILPGCKYPLSPCLAAWVCSDIQILKIETSALPAAAAAQAWHCAAEPLAGTSRTCRLLHWPHGNGVDAPVEPPLAELCKSVPFMS